MDMIANLWRDEEKSRRRMEMEEWKVRAKGRPRMGVVDDLMEEKYVVMKRWVEDRKKLKVCMWGPANSQTIDNN